MAPSARNLDLTRSTNLFAVALLAVELGCCTQREIDDVEESVVSRETCLRLCLLPLCDGATELDPRQGNICADQCIAKGRDVVEVGHECADAYSLAIECHIGLTCDDFHRWVDGDDTICHAERAAFTETCPGMTFDFRD
jgi:hypothetical protein